MVEERPLIRSAATANPLITMILDGNIQNHKPDPIQNCRAGCEHIKSGLPDLVTFKRSAAAKAGID
jgi:hypothetical protein